MSAVRVLVLGEGPSELGPKLDEALAPGSLPALAQIVHRLGQGGEDVVYFCRLFKPVGHTPGKGHKYARKVKQALREAWEEKFDAVVIVVDRDREPNAERIVPLRQGRDEMAKEPFPRCAVGAAVEAFDAWMIVDGNAVKTCQGDPIKTHLNPESLRGKEGKGPGQHPKEVAASIFGGTSGLADKYAAVAKSVDLDLLERCCPQGFAPFADEVRRRIVPAVGGR